MKIAVTGAFGYSGKYIAAKLLDAGHDVITLTNSPHRANPFRDRVRAFPFNFDHPAALAQSLQGVDALINTYWVRFDHKLFSHQGAVANTKVLFQAAKTANVRRIVHVSITNPDATSDLPYFRGKAQLEAALTSLGPSYCILRPTVLFGKEDVLVNNIAWSLRRLPVFGVFGQGDYKLQPIHVGDLAEAAVAKALESRNEIINAIGPETFTYRDLILAIKRAVNSHAIILNLPPALGYWGCRLTGALVRDVIITREEIRGLMENRLCVDAPPLGATRLTDWMDQNKATLGQIYSSELSRRKDRRSPYRP